MAAEIQDYEPEKLTAGVTWKWSKSLSDYPASDWGLNYYIRRNGAAETSFCSTADGGNFSGEYRGRSDCAFYSRCL